MRSVAFVLLTVAALGQAAIFDYTLDTNSDVNSAYLRVLCSHYEELETFNCSGGVAGIPADKRQNTSGFWTTCDRGLEARATPCTLAHYRTPNTVVLKSIVVSAYHNGNNARIRVHTSDPNNLDRIFNATDAWGTYTIDASVYSNIETLDNLQITAETAVGTIVFDKVVMQFDDMQNNGTTTTTSGPPVCVNGTQFQCDSGRCLPINWLCDGEVDCDDGSDETPERCPCAPNEFVCADGQCIPQNGRCNNIPNCRDGTDEHMCPCPGPEEDYWRCGGVGACIELDWRCDGVVDCVDGTDEENCTSIAVPDRAAMLRKTAGTFFLRH